MGIPESQGFLGSVSFSGLSSSVKWEMLDEIKSVCFILGPALVTLGRAAWKGCIGVVILRVNIGSAGGPTAS